jgi:hypothetical protein
MYENIDLRPAAAALLALCLAEPPALAADNAVPEQSSVITRCSECGMVYNIRRVEKSVAPGRETSPNIPSSPPSGGIGSEGQPVPLLSFGQGGAKRVQREPSTYSVWEMTIRYDNGQFGLVTQDSQPEFKVGDRVRRVDNTFEAIPQPGR